MTSSKTIPSLIQQIEEAIEEKGLTFSDVIKVYKRVEGWVYYDYFRLRKKPIRTPLSRRMKSAPKKEEEVALYVSPDCVYEVYISKSYIQTVEGNIYRYVAPQLMEIYPKSMSLLNIINDASSKKELEEILSWVENGEQIFGKGFFILYSHLVRVLNMSYFLIPKNFPAIIVQETTEYLFSNYHQLDPLLLVILLLYSMTDPDLGKKYPLEEVMDYLLTVDIPLGVKHSIYIVLMFYLSPRSRKWLVIKSEQLNPINAPNNLIFYESRRIVGSFILFNKFYSDNTSLLKALITHFEYKEAHLVDEREPFRETQHSLLTDMQNYYGFRIRSEDFISMEVIAWNFLLETLIKIDKKEATEIIVNYIKDYWEGKLLSFRYALIAILIAIRWEITEIIAYISAPLKELDNESLSLSLLKKFSQIGLVVLSKKLVESVKQTKIQITRTKLLTCPQCGNGFDPMSKQCPNCGYDVQCGVCGMLLEKNAELAQCPDCRSLFHKSHILEWLKVNPICPICKQKNLEKNLIMRPPI